jgi:hypothetical protein
VQAVGVTDDGTLVAIGSFGVESASADGGRTWTPADGDVAANEDRRTSCLPDGTCIELVGTAVIERRGDQATTLIEFDADEVAALDRLDPPSCVIDPFGGVAAVDRADGRHIVVAMGWLGTIHRGPAEVWEWVAVNGHGVQDVDASTRPLGLGVAAPIGTRGFGVTIPQRGLLVMFLMAPALAFGSIPFLIRMAGRRHRSAVAAVLVCVLVGVLIGLVSSLMAMFLLTGAKGRTASAAAIVVLGVAVVCIAPLWVWHARPGPPPPPPPPFPPVPPFPLRAPDPVAGGDRSGSDLPPPSPDRRVG